MCALAQVRGRANAAPGIDAAGSAQTVEAALHLMADQAAVIFVGTVAEIDRTAASRGIVQIRFTVEQAVRGCTSGTFTLREWAGLWTANDSRYHTGQRLLLLLHAPGPGGLSSPVGGLDGAIPVRASGSGVRATDTTTTTTEPVADLRWIGAKLVHSVVYRASKNAGSAVPHAMTSTLAAADAQQVQPSVSDSSQPAQEASVSSVVSMIHSFEVADATR